MMVVTSHNQEDYTAYLPDFVSYPNDLAKLGLKGNVKSCEMGASTIKWTFDFNPEGNLTNQQFRMDSQGRFGEGHRMEYNASGQLTFLGRDFHRQSPQSHTYTYGSNGKLAKREFGRAWRTYEWATDDKGTVYPVSVDTKELVPLMDMKYERKDGRTLLKSMKIKWPYLPHWTAEKGDYDFEYDSDGRLTQVNVAYHKCKGAPAVDLFGVSKYEYTEHGTVAKETYSIAKTKEALLTENALGTSITTYDYEYDEHDNWIKCAATKQPSYGTDLPLRRTIVYYSDTELAEIANEKKAEAERPFIGQWTFEDKEEFESPDGEKEIVNISGTIVLNLYDKFKPDYEDEMILGLMRFDRTPQNGMKQGCGYTITEASLSCNTVSIKFSNYYNDDKYSATLVFDPATKQMTFKDVKFLEEGSADEEYGLGGNTLEPIEGTFNFSSRSTNSQ